jgi:hypothetical protein
MIRVRITKCKSANVVSAYQKSSPDDHCKKTGVSTFRDTQQCIISHKKISYNFRHEKHEELILANYNALSWLPS